jgi:hypothetical protein
MQKGRLKAAGECRAWLIGWISARTGGGRIWMSNTSAPNRVISLAERQLEEFTIGLRGRVFHVTYTRNLQSIKSDGAIFVNHDGDRSTTFGDASNSLFRLKGCVSVFDYESPSDEKWHEHMWKCDPTMPGRDGTELSFLFLADAAKKKLIRWAEIASEWRGERVVPHVEAGHPGDIPLAHINEIILVSVIPDENSLAAILRRARKRGQDSEAEAE